MTKLLLPLLFFFSCEEKPKLKDKLPYKLETPTERYVLPAVLEEVSGIVWTGDNKIACIEDNFGDIYIFNLTSKTVTESIQFAGPGDFEDITLVDKSWYVLRSDGVLFRKDGETKKFETFLSGDNNTEGLCYDSLNNRLLFALKGKSVNGGKDTKEIFQFDLKEMQLEKEPLFSIHLSAFEPFFGPKAERLRFKPSGIGIHPFTRDIYIISSTAGLILRTNFKGEVKDVAWLDKSIYAQPEGICFDPEGNMYISNEGKNGEPDILKFRYQKHD